MTTPPLSTADARAIDLPGMFHRYRAPITSALRLALPEHEVPVYHLLRYYMGWVDVAGNPWVATEGKALRPTLCLFACEASGGDAYTAMPAAVALELIHNFSLIHDDIQDGDETRHHRPTLWPVWGMPKALVAGNVLRVIADKCLEGLVDQGMEPDRSLEAVGLLTEAYLEMIEGQYLDLSYEGRHDIRIDEYLGMISRKTGALIRCSVNLGALTGTRDAATVAAFRECGDSLGHVFQIRDDLLGVWGDEETTGKPVGADIRRKKNSFPLVYAMATARGKDRQLLVDIYGQERLTDDDVASVLDVMERVNVREHAESLAAQNGRQALEALAEVEMGPEARRELEELVHFLLVRQH